MRYLFYFLVLFFIYNCSVSGLCGEQSLKLGISGASFKSDVNCSYHDEPSIALSYVNLSKYNAVLVVNAISTGSRVHASSINDGVRINLSSFE